MPELCIPEWELARMPIWRVTGYTAYLCHTGIWLRSPTFWDGRTYAILYGIWLIPARITNSRILILVQFLCHSGISRLTCIMPGGTFQHWSVGEMGTSRNRFYVADELSGLQFLGRMGFGTHIMRNRSMSIPHWIQAWMGYPSNSQFALRWGNSHCNSYGAEG